MPTSVEASPDTATDEKLGLLRERGVTRLSLGVQTFFEDEALAASRPQKTATVERALDAIRKFHFPIVNVDLIYGLEHQTLSTWLASLRAALRWRPEELYLYPLYVRPLTGLGLSERAWDDERRALYRAGRDLLVAEGYEQVSMRMFALPRAGRDPGPAYCCQEDGMIGLGCGARSYARSVHWSSEYAVGAKGVRAILERWVERTREDFGFAEYGIPLDRLEQKRRFAIQSLLQREGLSFAHWTSRFETNVLDDLPQLAQLLDEGLAEATCERIALTADGLELSDAIGPWLVSEPVSALMREYALR